MHKHVLIAAALGAALLLSPHAAAQTHPPTEVADAPARVIVKYRSDSALLRAPAAAVGEQHARQARDLGARVGLELRAGAGLAERTQVLLAHGMTSDELARRLAAESDIEYAVPDQRRRRFGAPNDPLYLEGPAIAGETGGPAVGQWYLRAPAGDSAVVDRRRAGVERERRRRDDRRRGDRHRRALRSPRPASASPPAASLLPGYDMISDSAIANDGDGRDADAGGPRRLAHARRRSTQERGPFYGCCDAAEDSSWHGTQTSAPRSAR